MDVQEIKNCLVSQIKGYVLIAESMKKHTAWHIGGPADIMIIPSDIEDIIQCMRFAQDNQIPLTVMGNGSNLLVRDKGIRGIVLKISRGLNKIHIEGNAVTAEAGALVPLVAKQAAVAGLSGMEFAAGIPASIGGAVCMNAGAHGKSMSEIVWEVTALNPQGEILTLSNQESGFQYRKSSIIDKGLIVIKTEFTLVKGSTEGILTQNEANLVKRRHSQPWEYPNAGSVFANPPGQWAGWLIEQVGGKGMRVGGAMVSEKHANFFVNTGGATATDVLSLMAQIKELVHEKFNMDLKLEVRVIGE